MIVYMAIYLAMTLGTFAVILSMRRTACWSRRSPTSQGWRARSPAMAFFLATMMFSLAGIPPLAGFFAKYFVFLAAIKAGLYALAVIGVLASVVGAYYYLRIVKVMYFDEPAGAFEPMPRALEGRARDHRRVRAYCSSSIPSPLISAAAAAAKSLF